MRDIKEVLRGFIPSSEVKEWDVTPTVSVTTVTFENEGTYNTLFDNGLLNFNGISNPAPINFGVMKTNITMDLLASGDTYRFSLRMADILVEGARFAGMAILPGDLSAEQAHTLLKGLFGGNGSLPAPFVLNLTLAVGSSKESLVLGKLQTPTSIEIPIALSPTLLNGFILDTDYVEHLFLRKTSNSLYVAKELVDSDGSTYDIVGTQAINDVVFNDSLRLYIWGGSLIMGGGLAPNHANFYIEPTFDIVPISTLVAGTSYEAAGGTQATFNQDYPSIKRPLITTVTQKTFPVGIRPLELYKTIVTGSVSVPIQPYGISVQENQLVLINNVTPLQERFTPLVDSLTLGNYLAPITNQQDALVQSVADLGLLVQQSANDVNKALINASEMVAYVKSSSAPDPTFDSNITFSDLDEAFSYLTSFPKHIKKRIVLDDRSGVGSSYGNINSVYSFKENNICFSTYKAFTGKRIFHNPSLGNVGGLPTTIKGRFDGIRLESFEGIVSSDSVFISTDAVYHLFSDSFVCINIHAFNGGYLYISNHTCLVVRVDLTLPVENHPTISIYADETSPIDFDSYGLGVPNIGYYSKVTIYRRGCIRPDNLSEQLMKTEYVHRIQTSNELIFGQQDPFFYYMNLVNAQTIVARSMHDFGIARESEVDTISTYYNSINNFIVVGVIDFGSRKLRLANDVKIIGIGQPTIIAQGTLFEQLNTSAKLEVIGCKLVQQTSDLYTDPLINFTTPTDAHASSLILRDCLVDSIKPLTISNAFGDPSLYSTLQLDRVRFENLKHIMQISNITEVKITGCQFNLVHHIPFPIFGTTFKANVGAVRNLFIASDCIIQSANTFQDTIPPIMMIMGSYTPSMSIQPFIHLGEITTILKHSSTGHKEVKVFLGANEYDYFDDTNFYADQVGAYVFADGIINYNIGGPGDPENGAFTPTDLQVRLFQVHSSAMIYFGLKQKRFLVELTGKGTIPTNSCAINLKRRLTASLSGYSGDNPITLETHLFSNVANTVQTFKFKRVVTLSNIHCLVLEATNNIDAMDLGFEVSWSITEL